MTEINTTPPLVVVLIVASDGKGSMMKVEEKEGEDEVERKDAVDGAYRNMNLSEFEVYNQKDPKYAVRLMWVHYSHIKTIGGAVAPPVPTPLYCI